MNIRKCIITTSIALTSFAANADTIPDPSQYKFAVFNDAGIVEKMKTQPLDEFISEANGLKNGRASYTQFENLSGLCLAYLKQLDYSSAEQSCGKALDVAKKPVLRANREVMALAYNNRAIARALASNNVGALDDFRSAMDIYQAELIVSNLDKIVSAMNNK